MLHVWLGPATPDDQSDKVRFTLSALCYWDEADGTQVYYAVLDGSYLRLDSGGDIELVCSQDDIHKVGTIRSGVLALDARNCSEFNKNVPDLGQRLSLTLSPDGKTVGGYSFVYDKKVRDVCAKVNLEQYTDKL